MIISKERNSLLGRKYFISGLNREFFMVPASKIEYFFPFSRIFLKAVPELR